MSQLANLPIPLTPLVGREPDLRRIGEMLTRPDTRHLTLSGAGGIGKTRLALQVALTVREEFPDGVTFVPLAPLTDAALVPAAIANSLDLAPDSAESIPEALIDYYQNQCALLILDNFEHVMSAATLVPRLATACPDLVILVTSRERLGTTGEQVLRIEPLPLPPAETATVARVIGSPAIQLFVERAAAARPGFALSEENAADVATICRRVDGLPLAIELAAARVAHLSPKEIATNFERLLPLLEGGAPDLPARLRTMGDAVCWSYELLAPEEQALFRRLSVFAGGCTIEAATEVGVRRFLAADAGPDQGYDPQTADIETILRLASLVDKSLLRFSDQAGAESRYTMLEPIREYGLAQLAALGQERETRLAHAEYLIDLAERLRVDLRDPEPGEWISRLEAEQDNFRAALQWLLDGEASERVLALKICHELAYFWLLRGRSAEGKTWLQQAVERAGDDDPGEAAGIYLYLGHFSHGNPQLAMRHYQRSLEIYRQLEQSYEVAGLLGSLGMAAEQLGEYQESRTYLEESLNLFQQQEDAYGVAQASFHLGVLMGTTEEFERAKEMLDTARGLWEQQTDVVNVAYAIKELGRVYRLQRRLDEATDLLEWSLDRLEQIRIRHVQGPIHVELGEIALLRDDAPLATRLFQQALRLMAEAGVSDWSMANSLAGLARVALRQRQPELAARVLAAITSWQQVTGFRSPAQEAVNQQAADSARNALGQVRFDAVWEQGRRISLAEAAELVRTIVVPAESPRPTVERRVSSEVDQLTRQERRVICLIAEGMSNQQIADTLSITVRTAANHVTNILSKIGVENRTQAAAVAMRQQLCAAASTSAG